MGSKGLGGHARIRGGGGGGGMGSGKSHLWVDLDLNPLPPLTKFPGSAHGGQFISLECIRTDCLMEDQVRGGGGGGGGLVILYQLGAWDWLKMMAFTWLR